MRVIVSIFAGWQKYLEILFVYLDRLLARSLITDVHIWNYSRLSNDKKWVSSIRKCKYTLFEPQNDEPHQWTDYYMHYGKTRELSDNDILIKCDDDIVFIDVDTFALFIAEIVDNAFYCPNIVNNEVCAFIQSTYGVHALQRTLSKKHRYPGSVDLPSYWTHQYHKADAIHTDFKNNHHKYSLKVDNIHWTSRISINFFAARGASVREAFALFYDNACEWDDEAFFAYHKRNFVVVIFFCVVHFSFCNQNEKMLIQKHLKDYVSLAQKWT